jgi:hypothetical protein
MDNETIDKVSFAMTVDHIGYSSWGHFGEFF